MLLRQEVNKSAYMLHAIVGYIPRVFVDQWIDKRFEREIKRLYPDWRELHCALKQHSVITGWMLHNRLKHICLNQGSSEEIHRLQVIVDRWDAETKGWRISDDKHYIKQLILRRERRKARRLKWRQRKVQVQKGAKITAASLVLLCWILIFVGLTSSLYIAVYYYLLATLNPVLST
ncbi:hypothetical protein ACFL04_00835 [Patescibacteria group bacterium]